MIYSVQSYDSETGWFEIGAANDPDHALEVAEMVSGGKLEFNPHLFVEGDGMLSDPDTNGIVYRVIRTEEAE